MSRIRAADKHQSEVDLWYALLRTTASLRAEVRQVFASFDLTGPQWGVLRVIGEAGPEGIMLSRIADRLVFSYGNATGIVDRLADAGYVRREPHPDDRRALLAVLTDRGRELYEDVVPPFRALVGDLVGCLTEKQRAALLEALDALAANLHEPDAE